MGELTLALRASTSLPWIIRPSRAPGDYLARSTSTFYGLLGGLLWVLSGDLRRHRLALHYVGAAVAVFDLLLLGVDILEGMPPWWTAAEGMRRESKDFREQARAQIHNSCVNSLQS